MPPYRPSARQLRLASGIVLLTYLSTHLATHMAGLASLAAAEAGLRLSMRVWHSVPGTAALAIGIAEAVLWFIRRWLVARSTMGVEADIRKDLYARLQILPMSFHGRWQSGQLLSRVMNDLATIRRLLSFGLIFLVLNGIQITVVTAILLVMYWPLGGIGGVCQLITGAYIGKRIALLEKFSVAEWVRVVKTYGIRRSGLQPAAVRMLLDADLPPEDLASLDFVMSASGPLDPEIRDAFERRYGVPVLLAYGATEFAGSVCTWTPELYREFGAVKRTSSGRVLPDTEVRIIDPETGEPVPTDHRGLLEAKIATVSPDWIRTNDLASVDADGFITLHGRADGAINRGGFKVLPEAVRRVLVSHPAVRDAAVVGVPDARLGEVPFAAVETIPGCPLPAPAELMDLVRDQLPKHCVPVGVAVVDELPRTQSLKVSLRDVAAMYRRD
mgnify:CR=1 FL=1